MNFFKKLIGFNSFLFLSLSCVSTPTYAKDVDYESLQKFSQILDMVEEYYVEEVNQKDLIEGSIKGMLESLDPHSTYMNEEEFSMMQESTSGEFFGIGAELSLENGQPVVISPIEDTPAFRAGIKSGDIIISVDGKLTLDRSLTETVSLIRGEKGTPVKLVILPKGGTETKTVDIIRGAIPYISVKSEELEPGYLWLRLSFFNEKTTSEIQKAIKKAQADGPLKGVILDMRNNPGGILNEAATVSDIFLDKGVIVSVEGRSVLRRRFSASKKPTDLLDIPLVVLINSGSASASEIVAGALSDHKRALLIGEKSFGKGSVQNLIEMPNGTGIKLTVAFYYTPDGRSIQAEGIEPNMEVSFEEEPKENQITIRENDLNLHLDTEKEGKETVKKFPAPELLPLTGLSKKTTELLEKDRQLRTALQVVKDMPNLSEL